MTYLPNHKKVNYLPNPLIFWSKLSVELNYIIDKKKICIKVPTFSQAH